MQLFPGSKITSPPSSKQLSILGWIKPDATDEGTVVVSFWYKKNESKNVNSLENWNDENIEQQRAGRKTNIISCKYGNGVNLDYLIRSFQ